MHIQINVGDFFFFSDLVTGRIFFSSSVSNWFLYLYFFVFFMHSRMLYMDDQYLSFVSVGILNTLLDFLIEVELIISYELTLCVTFVLFSLHLPLYAWVLNLVMLYHIFFANLNHLLDSSFSSWFFATHSFFLYFSNLYGYEIDFVSFKDLEESFFFILSPKNTLYSCFYHFSKIYFS